MTLCNLSFFGDLISWIYDLWFCNPVCNISDTEISKILRFKKSKG